jgi:serine/threonine protein phosphatase PrpC
VFELAQLEEVFHVALGKPLGLVFEEVAPGQPQGLRVAEVAVGGAAARSGAVLPGDCLVAVGPAPVHQRRFDAVMDRLRYSTGAKPLALAFRRPVHPDTARRARAAAAAARQAYANSDAGKAAAAAAAVASAAPASAVPALRVVSSGACALQGLRYPPLHNRSRFLTLPHLDPVTSTFNETRTLPTTDSYPPCRYAMEDRVFLASDATTTTTGSAVTTAPFDPTWLQGSTSSGSRAVAAVFDGHAGSGGADFCARELATALAAAAQQAPAAAGPAASALASLLAPALAPAGVGSEAADAAALAPPSAAAAAAVAVAAGAWRELCKQWGSGDGSGAVGTIAIVAEDEMGSDDDSLSSRSSSISSGSSTNSSNRGGVVVAVANCGDSRAVLLEFTEPLGAQRQRQAAAAKAQAFSAPVIVAAQTADHRTDNPDELARVAKAGGKVACDRGERPLVGARTLTLVLFSPPWIIAESAIVSRWFLVVPLV